MGQPLREAEAELAMAEDVLRVMCKNERLSELDGVIATCQEMRDRFEQIQGRRRQLSTFADGAEETYFARQSEMNV
jgi:hypothetical protein